MERELLHRFAAVARVHLVYEDCDGNLTAYFDSTEDSPLVQDAALRRRLREGLAAKSGPYLLQDDFHAYFMTLPYRGGWLHMGPMLNGKLEPLRLSAFYRSYGIRTEDTHVPRNFSMRQIRDTVVLLTSLLSGNPAVEEDLVFRNTEPAFREEALQRELSESSRVDESSREAEEFKHTYRDEQRLLEAVREGRTKDVIRLSEQMDTDAGRLSEKEINHWRAMAVVGITLISRSAIAAGMPPETAYRLSGYYISKCIAAKERSVIRQYRTRAIEDLVERVSQLSKKTQGTSYTAKSKDYIHKYFREKIYIEDIAEPLGISAGYLAKLFKKETGLSIQEYVSQVRVERAANLLIYSEMSIPAIAQYVHFPTQSYFGKVFKELKGLTPNEYRKRNRVHEFFEK